jgi:hypothetical protein
MYTPDWLENDIPVACSCKTCHGHCIYTHFLLYCAVFEPRVRVPPEYIAKTVAERQRCKSAKGTACRKRLKLLAELADDEKETDSEVNEVLEGNYSGARSSSSGDGAQGPASMR